MNPSVSVIMPVYNGELYVRKAIDSLLKQTFTDFELIIINDGSTDRSMEIIESFNDPRILIIKNIKNTGLSAVRNQGLSAARCEFIAILDCDDIALPERLYTQKHFLDNHPSIGLLGTAVDLIDETGKKKGVRWKSEMTVDELRIALLFHNRFAQSSIMLRKSILRQEIYREGYAPAEDYDLWLRLAKNAQIQNIPTVYTLYRVHEKGSSQQQKEKQTEGLKNIHRNLLKELSISASDEDLALHRKRLHNTQSDIISFLRKKELWLIKLQQANKETQVYPIEQFINGTGREWFENCYANTRYGFAVWNIYSTSTLSKTSWTKKYRDKFKLFIKCLLHRE